MGVGPAPLAELLKINDQNLSDVEGISDLLQGAPLLDALVADSSSNGTQHKYLKQTGAATVGFREINNGLIHGHSVDTPVSVDLKFLDASFHVDSAYADEFKDGRDAWLAREANRAMAEAFTVAEAQLINGTDALADGFTGLVDAATINALADPMVVAGGGTVALSSVYLIRSTSDLRNAVVITGNEGNISLGDTYSQMMAGADEGLFNAYVTAIGSWLALQVGSIFSLGRIANIDAGSNTLDDDLISSAIEAFPSAGPPTHLCMNRRSNGQLQRSRTATNATGAAAPFPESAFGIPIVLSDGVSNDETVLT
jgi:hypothetical protein